MARCELLEGSHAQQPEANAHLFLEQFQRAHQARHAGSGESQAHEPPEPHGARTQREGRVLLGFRKSIVEPQINVDPAYWRLKATTTDGRTLTGLRMNEDTYTVQFLDDHGKLRSVPKSSLTKYEIIRTSPMPLLNLTDAQIDDLIAYMSK